MEEKAFALCNGRLPQQRFGDFKNNLPSTESDAFPSVHKGLAAWTNLRGLFSPTWERAFLEGMEHFGKIIPGFDREDAILTAIESRTSSPVRMLRDETYQSPLRAIYPCGEGAGYAGGIVSAAMDGIRIAQAIAHRYQPFERDI